jgi:hypothetical protein
MNNYELGACASGIRVASEVLRECFGPRKDFFVGQEGQREALKEASGG